MILSRWGGNRSFTLFEGLFRTLFLTWEYADRVSFWGWRVNVKFRASQMTLMWRYFEFPWSHLSSKLVFVCVYHRLSQQVKCYRIIAELTLLFSKLIKYHLSHNRLTIVYFRFYIIEALRDKLRKIKLWLSWSFNDFFWYHEVTKAL